jgi:hypothetical protein
MADGGGLSGHTSPWRGEAAYMPDGAGPSQTHRIGKLPRGLRRGQPVGALAAYSDGGETQADPTTCVPVLLSMRQGPFGLCRGPPAFAPAVMFPQVRPKWRAGYGPRSAVFGGSDLAEMRLSDAPRPTIVD